MSRECLVLKEKLGGQAKGVGLVSPVLPAANSLPNRNSVKTSVFSPFITNGFVSLVGKKSKRVPAWILRDISARFLYFGEKVLPFGRV